MNEAASIVIGMVMVIVAALAYTLGYRHGQWDATFDLTMPPLTKGVDAPSKPAPHESD